MGAKLTQFYEEAKKIGGIKAQMRMVILTKMPSTQASISPDSQENINIFQNALNEIKKESGRII